MPAPFRLRSAVRTGLTAGGLFGTLLLAVRVGVRLTVPATTRDSDEFKISLYIGGLLLAILVEAAVAALVAHREEQLGVAQGLFSASLAGAVMAAEILGLNLLFGGAIDFALIAQTMWLVIGAGAPVVGPIAVAASVLTRPHNWVRVNHKE